MDQYIGKHRLVRNLGRACTISDRPCGRRLWRNRLDIGRYIDGDHDARTKIARDSDGNRLCFVSIVINHAADPHRRELAGRRARCTHGGGGVAAIENGQGTRSTIAANGSGYRQFSFQSFKWFAVSAILNEVLDGGTVAGEAISRDANESLGIKLECDLLDRGSRHAVRVFKLWCIRSVVFRNATGAARQQESRETGTQPTDKPGGIQKPATRTPVDFRGFFRISAVPHKRFPHSSSSG